MDFIKLEDELFIKVRPNSSYWALYLMLAGKVVRQEYSRVGKCFKISEGKIFEFSIENKWREHLPTMKVESLNFSVWAAKNSNKSWVETEFPMYYHKLQQERWYYNKVDGYFRLEYIDNKTFVHFAEIEELPFRADIYNVSPDNEYIELVLN